MTMQTSTAKKPPEPKRMALSAVSRGIVQAPWRILIYGTEGVGKTTFAAGAPSPIFLPTEDGTNQLDVARFPRVERWPDFVEAFDSLKNDQHDYKTLVVDTLDGAEPICWRYLCETHPKRLKSIEDFGYGKGYAKAQETWVAWLHELEQLQRVTGMNVILIAHAHIKRWKNPEDEDFDRYTLKLHEKSAGVLKEWAEEVLFARYETYTAQKGDNVDGQKIGVSTGARIIHTHRTAAFDAKERHGLPEQMPLSWDEFASAMVSGEDPAKLAEEVATLAATVGGDDAAKAIAAVERANGDARKLRQLLDWLRGRSMTKEVSS